MRALRCRNCATGNIMTEAVAGGHIFELKCLACGFSPGEYTVQQFERRVGAKGVKRALQGNYPIWVR